MTTAMVDERSRAIDLAIGQIEKQFGRGAIMRLGEQHRLEVEAIPTGSVGLDLALGIGGVPRGRITEIFGPESAGKSTLAQHIIAEAQKTGGLAAYIDVEHALEPIFARAIGVKVEDLLVSQPDTGEQALEIVEALIRSGGVDVVVNFTGGETWVPSLKVLHRGGKVLTCGATAGFDPREDLRFIWTFELKILGANGWMREDLVTLLTLIQQGRLRPVIDCELPLEEVNEAFRLLEDREVFGKVVVRP